MQRTLDIVDQELRLFRQAPVIPCNAAGSPVA
jgi:hypothetical protein